MNHNKLIATGLILIIGVFLAAGCIGGGQGNKEYKNCGTVIPPNSTAMDCFKKAYKNNCTPAKITETDKNKSFLITYAIEDSGKEKLYCTVSLHIEKADGEIVPSKTEGKKITCKNTGINLQEYGYPYIKKAYQNDRCIGDTKIFKDIILSK